MTRPQGSAEFLAADADARHPAVIGDGNPLKVRGDGLVGPEHFSDVARVMDGGVEVRVIADTGRHAVFNRNLRHQAGSQGRHLLAAGLAFKQGEQAVAQGLPRTGTHGEKIIQAGLRAGRRGLRRQAVQTARGADMGQVDHLVANGHATAKGLVAKVMPEHGEGQVLDRKIAAGRIGRRQPACRCRVVGGVELHGGQTPGK
jgi:hypothetical protein